MMIKSMFMVIVAVLLCVGCQSRQKRMFEQFGEMEENSVAAYTNAATPSLAIHVLNDYLSELDRFENVGLQGIYFDLARSYAEARLSELHSILGQGAKADNLMNMALQHHGSTNLTPEAMLDMVQKLDAPLKPKWRNDGFTNKPSEAIQ